jgi:aldehyde dehydrogenase (NAD+)
MKVAPALATGNSVIVKVSEFNPFSEIYLGELTTQAGIPDVTINIFAGAAEAGQAMSSHMSIRKISFTGSPIIGRKVQVAAAQSNLKRVTLELGGKSPVLTFDDADLETFCRMYWPFSPSTAKDVCLGRESMFKRQ